jgi:hypothetical protein
MCRKEYSLANDDELIGMLYVITVTKLGLLDSEKDLFDSIFPDEVSDVYELDVRFLPWGTSTRNIYILHKSVPDDIVLSLLTNLIPEETKLKDLTTEKIRQLSSSFAGYEMIPIQHYLNDFTEFVFKRIASSGTTLDVN